MNERVFIDTGAYIAFFHKQDAKRKEAVLTWEQLNRDEVTLFTTYDVINEFATLLGRKTDYLYSAKQTHLLYISDVEIIYPEDEDFKLALSFFKKYADQKVSFADCFSFVTMQKLNIEHVFTFDKHFAFAGFKIIPQ